MTTSARFALSYDTQKRVLSFPVDVFSMKIYIVVMDVCLLHREVYMSGHFI